MQSTVSTAEFCTYTKAVFQQKHHRNGIERENQKYLNKAHVIQFQNRDRKDTPLDTGAGATFSEKAPYLLTYLFTYLLSFLHACLHTYLLSLFLV